VRERRRVLLVDDHEMARRGLGAMLATADWIELVGEAADCESAVAAATTLAPDLILLDIRMPGTDGLACLETIKASAHPAAVVMVTLYDDRHYILEAIRRGASGYLLKDASTDEVLNTLELVLDGQLAIPADLLRDALTIPAPSDPGRSREERAREFNLTPRELDVLVHVAEGETNKEIARHLGISEDTVKKHVQNVIWKMRAADRTQAAIIALKTGLFDS